MKLLQSLRVSVTAKFLFIVLILSTLIIVMIPQGLKNFFTEEAYRMIEQIQNSPFNYESETLGFDRTRVNHMYISYHEPTNHYTIGLIERDFDLEFIEQVKNQVNVQEEVQSRYVFNDEQRTIFYVIKIIEQGETSQYLISFVYITYVQGFVRTLFLQLFTIITIIMVITLLISVYFANSITDPLVTISRNIRKIADNNWDEAIPQTRDDEIGLIEEALEEMRVSLKKQNKIQQEMYQNISHDLKTPIMIIEGYSQSILDGYVNDDEIPDTVQSILEEAKRLEQKVKSLLYISKLDQLYSEQKDWDELEAAQLIETVVTPFQTQLQHLQFIVEIETDDVLYGVFDEWRVALENIIDNMTRFARTTISITYDEIGITIFNDGEPIDEAIIEDIFKPYRVGQKANFGLGLAITKKAIEYFGYQIRAYNVQDGVIFQIRKDETINPKNNQ